MTTEPQATPTFPSPGTHRWPWYFATLAVLTVLAVTVLAVFNLRLQLKPEQLAAARKLWEQKGPPNYQLKYNVKKGDETEGDTFVVQVRDGRGTSVQLNGRPRDKDHYFYHGMEALFDDIERFLKMDAEKGKPRTYMRGLFDPADGHLLHYVRRVMGSRERVEITVQSLEPPADRKR